MATLGGIREEHVAEMEKIKEHGLQQDPDYSHDEPVFTQLPDMFDDKYLYTRKLVTRSLFCFSFC